MPVERIAIVSEVPALTPAVMAPVVAALQKQIDEHFGPIWGVEAELVAVVPPQAAPHGAWTLTLKEHVEGPELGFHHDAQGRPFAVIEYGDTWSLTASHELLEMLLDPLGNHILPGPSPAGDPADVQFLIEVCDPCAAHAYEIDGVSVADFVTREYYDASSAPGTRCSFNGSVTTPLEVLEGGYITWLVPEAEIVCQERWPAGGQPAYSELGPHPNLADEQKRLREWVDHETLRGGMVGPPHAPAP